MVGFYLAFDNETFIEIIKVSHVPQSGVIRHFAIEVDDIDEAYRDLKQGGVDVTAKEWAGDNNWMITCYDPNGVYIELQQYSERSLQRVGGRCEVDYNLT